MTRLTKALAEECQLIRAAATMPGTGGAVYRSVLPMNQCMAIGDCLASTNGMFFALMESDGQLRAYRGAGPSEHQGWLWQTGRGGDGGRFFALLQTDGNFCIYRGEDLAHNEGWHWGTQMTADGGQFYLTLLNDGNLRVCKGSGAGDYQGTVWSSDVIDPVQRIDQVLRIDYDLDHARLVQARPSDLYRETVNNNSGQVQTSMISGSVTVSDTTGWSDDLALGASAPATFKGAVPVVSGAKVVLSAEAGHFYIRNGAASTAKTWGFNAPAAVPPHSSMMCLVVAIRSAIVVPYTLSGRFTLTSGKQVAGTVCGSFTGSNCHDLSVTLTTYNPNPAGSSTISHPLTPMPSVSGPAMPHPTGDADSF